MNRFHYEKDKIYTLLEYLRRISLFKTEEIVRPELEGANLEVVRDKIEKIITWSKLALEHQELWVDEYFITDLFTQIEYTARVFESMKTIIQTDRPPERVEKYQTEIKKVFFEIYHALYLPYLSQIEISEVINSEKIIKKSKELQEVITELEAKKNDVETIISDLENLSGKGTTLHFITQFNEQADKNWRAALIWLVLSMIGFISLACYLNDSLNKYHEQILKLDFQKAILYGIPNLVVYSLFIYGFYQLIRNYNINANLSSMYRLKAHTWRLFPTLQDSLASEENARTAIAVQMISTTLSHIDSGFTSTRDVNINAIDSVANLLKK